MNAAWWQAAAEIAGVALVLLNILGGMFIYRMQASFVTRAEHSRMGDRLEGVEGEVDAINIKMARLMTVDQADAMFDRMGTVEKQGAEILGRMSGMDQRLANIDKFVSMLVQNEIDGERK